MSPNVKGSAAAQQGSVKRERKRVTGREGDSVTANDTTHDGRENTGVVVDGTQVGVVPASANQWHATEPWYLHSYSGTSSVSPTDHQQRRPALSHSDEFCEGFHPDTFTHGSTCFSRMLRQPLTTFISQQPTCRRLRQYHNVLTTAIVDMAVTASFNEN